MPSSAVAGACPRTWPTCSWSGSTVWTSRRAALVRVASAAGQRVPHDLLARVAPGHGGPARRRPARGARRQRAGAGERGRVRVSARAARRGGVRRPPARRADAAAHGVRRGGARAPRSSAEPPTSPGTRSPPTTCPRRCRPASTPGSRRSPPVAPTRRPGTSPRRWRSTTGPPASSTTRRSRRSWWRDRGGAVRLGASGDGAVPGGRAPRLAGPGRSPRCRGPGCSWRAPRR